MSKSTRLLQIDGNFHGVHFQVKPTPIAIRKFEREVNEMLRGWFEEHHPEVLSKTYTEKDIREASPEQLEEISEFFSAQMKWMEDEEFRAKYCRKMAEYCMAFDSEVPEEIWTSDELEYSTIREAWDFFCGRRRIPQSGPS